MYFHRFYIAELMVLYLFIKTPFETLNVLQVPETLSEEALTKMGAPPKREDVPVISPAELADADGLIFGFPTRFGMMPAQFKAFLDGTSELWCPQRLAGKPAALFFSTGCQGGGQETTA
jgi:NAD(P)H dehydrogenase (quinone)